MDLSSTIIQITCKVKKISSNELNALYPRPDRARVYGEVAKIGFDSRHNISAEQLSKIHYLAHKNCFIANSLSSEMKIIINDLGIVKNDNSAPT